jgi:hypothetical protein
MNDPIHVHRLYHLALVTTFVPGPIREPEGMMIVEERQLQPWRRARGRWTPQTGAGTRYIVPVPAIQSAAHLVPLEPIADNKRWYLKNTVDLETFNFG